MPAGGWAAGAEQTAQLTANDGGADDLLGLSVAISGDTIVAGAPEHTEDLSVHQGAAYVFVMPAGGWTSTDNQTAELTMNDGVDNDQLGSSVAISGNTVVAGAPVAHGRLERATGCGVRVRDAARWVARSRRQPDRRVDDE